MAIYAFYSWKKALDVGLDAPLDNKYGWKEHRRKQRTLIV
jgi:hypothetical protein